MTPPLITTSLQPVLIGSGSSYTAEPQQLVIVSAFATFPFTVNLPSVVGNNGAQIGIALPLAASGVNYVEILAFGSEKIVANNVNGLNYIRQGAPLSTTILEATDLTSGFAHASAWNMIAGEYNTGWAPLTMPAGFTGGGLGGSSPFYRVKGDHGQLVGVIHSGSGGFFSQTLPQYMSPPAVRLLNMASSVSPGFEQVSISSGSSPTLSFPTSTNEFVFLDGFIYPI